MNRKKLARQDYRAKLILATHDGEAPLGQRRSLLGCIVLAALDKRPKMPPYFVGKATITADGFVMCDFLDFTGYHIGALVCRDEEMVRNVVGLVNHCNLSEEEKVDFLARVNHWIETDNRPASRIRRVMVVDR